MQLQGVLPTIITYTSLLFGSALEQASACWRSRSRHVQQVFEAMRLQGLLSNAISYNSLLNAYWKTKQPERALDVFDAMRK